MKLTPIVLVLLGAAALTACAPVQGTGKTGAQRSAVRLVIADSQPSDAPSALAAKMFADEVSSHSGGRMTVEVRAAGEYADEDHGDSRVIDALTSGEIQLATVPTRAWSDVGVRTTDVLQAPFEVTSTAHMVAVASDDRLTAASLAGLEQVGAHGLGLVPEALRVVIGFDEPVVQPADLQGRFQTLSTSIGSIVADLGASPVDLPDDQYAEQRASGGVRATELDLVRAVTIAAGSHASTDLVLYAKFVSIAANEKWWAGLSEQQREWLAEAAGATREQVSGATRTLDDDAEAFCEAGGVVDHAGHQGLRAFHDALAPRLDALDQDSLEMLRADRPSTAEPAPEQCAPSSDSLDPTHVRPEAGELPDGVYRFRWTGEWARAWNTGPDRVLFEGQDAPGSFDVITITWTLREGHYTFAISHDDDEPFVVQGVYQVDGDQLLLALTPDIGNVVNRLRWKVNADRSLSMTQIDGLRSDPYYGLAWTRIGDAG